MRSFAGLSLALVAAGCGGGSAGQSAHEPQAAAVCPAYVLDAAESEGQDQGGTCVQPDVLGEDVAEACRAELAARGWIRDELAERAIASETGTRVICLHSP